MLETFTISLKNLPFLNASFTWKKTHSRSQLVFSPPLLAAVALQTSGAAVETSGQSLPISPCMKTKEPKCSLNYGSRAVPTWPDVLLSRKAEEMPRKDVTNCFLEVWTDKMAETYYIFVAVFRTYHHKQVTSIWPKQTMMKMCAGTWSIATRTCTNKAPSSLNTTSKVQNTTSKVHHVEYSKLTMEETLKEIHNKTLGNWLTWSPTCPIWSDSTRSLFGLILQVSCPKTQFSQLFLATRITRRSQAGRAARLWRNPPWLWPCDQWHYHLKTWVA